MPVEVRVCIQFVDSRHVFDRATGQNVWRHRVHLDRGDVQAAEPLGSLTLTGFSPDLIEAALPVGSLMRLALMPVNEVGDDDGQPE